MDDIVLPERKIGTVASDDDAGTSRTKKTDSRAQPAPPHRDSVVLPSGGGGGGQKKTKADPLVWPMVALIGIGAALEFFAGVNEYRIVGLVVPVLCVVIYPVYGWSKGYTRQPSLRERLADNAYYMGFILTQVSLLEGFGLPVLINRPVMGKDILSYFGVAIAASMVGLIARTLIVQTGHTVSENADMLQLQVEQYAEAVDATAKNVFSSATSINVELGKTVAAAVEMQKKMTSGLTAWKDGMTSGLETYRDVLSQQITAAQNNVKASNAAAKATTDAAANGTASLENSINTLSDGIAALQEEVSSRLRLTTEALRDHISEFHQSSERALDAQSSTVNATRDCSQRIAEIVAKLETLRDAMTGIQDVKKTVQSLQSTLNVEMHSSREVLAQTNAELKTMHQGVTAAAQQTAEIVGGGLVTVRETMARAETLGQGISDTMATANEKTQIAVDALSRIDDIKRDLDATVNAIQSVLREFRIELDTNV